MSREFSSANWSPQKNNFCHAFPEFCRASTRNNLLICSPLTPEIQFQTSECYLLIQYLLGQIWVGQAWIDQTFGQLKMVNQELVDQN
jgi:hypothetical protein